MRRGVQKFVDKKFFRVAYDFHKAQREFLEEIKFASSPRRLAELVTERTDIILPVTRIGLFVVETSNDRLRLLAHRNFDILERHGVHLEKEQIKTDLELPVALEDKIEPGIHYEPADEEVFKRWGMALVLPMLSGDRKLLGFLVLGKKRSGSRFTIEDVSLLTSVTAHSGIVLERLSLEWKLALEQSESERLSELNQLKSYFVSSVSHDLKTPLTSIRLFAELLKEKEDLPRIKTNEYLGIIEGEADRLSRLITNVLDFAKIEKGTKEYNLASVDLNSIVRNVLHSLEYQIRSKGFEVFTILDPTSLAIHGDDDAIADAVTNLITNAMKYSPADRKHITVTSSMENNYAVVSIEDEGYGIAHSEIEHIFEPFYRIKKSVMNSAGGAGLGLSLVKHTMDAHNGRVEVRSELGKGSIFVLYFPMEQL
jgi:signal transduction histidine kinase